MFFLWANPQRDIGNCIGPLWINFAGKPNCGLAHKKTHGAPKSKTVMGPTWDSQGNWYGLALLTRAHRKLTHTQSGAQACLLGMGKTGRLVMIKKKPFLHKQMQLMTACMDLYQSWRAYKHDT